MVTAMVVRIPCLSFAYFFLFYSPFPLVFFLPPTFCPLVEMIAFDLSPFFPSHVLKVTLSISILFYFYSKPGDPEAKGLDVGSLD